jgi:hypothetical protein
VGVRGGKPDAHRLADALAHADRDTDADPHVDPHTVLATSLSP